MHQNLFPLKQSQKDHNEILTNFDFSLALSIFAEVVLITSQFMVAILLSALVWQIYSSRFKVNKFANVGNPISEMSQFSQQPFLKMLFQNLFSQDFYLGRCLLFSQLWQ